MVLKILYFDIKKEKEKRRAIDSFNKHNTSYFYFDVKKKWIIAILLKMNHLTHKTKIRPFCGDSLCVKTLFNERNPKKNIKIQLKSLNE